MQIDDRDGADGDADGPSLLPQLPHRLCRPSLCPFASVLLPHEYMNTAIFAARLQKRSKFLALLGNFLYIFYLKLPQAAMSLGWCWRQTRSVDFSPVRERKFEWFDSTFAATQSFFLVLSRSSSREAALSPRFRRENDCLPAKNSHLIAITRAKALVASPVPPSPSPSASAWPSPLPRTREIGTREADADQDPSLPSLPP